MLPVYLPSGNALNAVSQNWVEQGAYVQGYCRLKLHLDSTEGSFGSQVTEAYFVENTYLSTRKTVDVEHGQTEVLFPKMSLTGSLTFTVYCRDTRRRSSDLFAVTIPNQYHDQVAMYDDDGVQMTDEQGNPMYYDSFTVARYASPEFQYHYANRVNDNGDISENGTAVMLEAMPVHTAVMPGDVEHYNFTDLNAVTIDFAFTDQGAAYNGNEWYPQNLMPPSISQALLLPPDGTPKFYGKQQNAYFYPQIQTYAFRYRIWDVMTWYLDEVAQAEYQTALAQYEAGQLDEYPVSPPSNAFVAVEPLGVGDSTVFFKKSGLGLGIGMRTQSASNMRCLEISDKWEIRHVADADNYYLIPDVVFTPVGDPNPPRKKKGRIWLHEIG